MPGQVCQARCAARRAPPLCQFSRPAGNPGAEGPRPGTGNSHSRAEGHGSAGDAGFAHVCRGGGQAHVSRGGGPLETREILSFRFSKTPNPAGARGAACQHLVPLGWQIPAPRSGILRGWPARHKPVREPLPQLGSTAGKAGGPGSTPGLIYGPNGSHGLPLCLGRVRPGEKTGLI